MTMEEIDNLSLAFVAKNGLHPTHVLMTIEQQKDLSSYLKPKERIQSAGDSGYDGGVAVLHLSDNILLDVVTIVPMRSGHTHGLEYPIVVNLLQESDRALERENKKLRNEIDFLYKKIDETREKSGAI